MIGLLIVGAILWWLLSLVSPKDSTVGRAAGRLGVFSLLGACVLGVVGVVSGLFTGKS